MQSSWVGLWYQEIIFLGAPSNQCVEGLPGINSGIQRWLGHRLLGSCCRATSCVREEAVAKSLETSARIEGGGESNRVWGGRGKGNAKEVGGKKSSSWAEAKETFQMIESLLFKHVAPSLSCSLGPEKQLWRRPQLASYPLFTSVSVYLCLL